MKILLVSMNNIHFRRWSGQLKDSGHEVYWFDMLDQGYIPSLSWVTQVVDWKKGFLKKRGRTLVKKSAPRLYEKLSMRYDVSIETAFSNALDAIAPDVVHSFALYLSCTPILSVMLNNPSIKWLYSAWGSDLYHFQHEPHYLNDIKAVLPNIDYLFTDCHRDYDIAKKYGFEGKFLGVFPGGGGYDLEAFQHTREHIDNRNIIALKGYENRSGRALNVLKALEQLSNELSGYHVVVFGAENDEVFRFRESEIPNITIHGLMSHQEIIHLFGQTLIYIGNSNSDGMPNTLLEAICAGAFVIQSNPGGVTQEIITDGQNGLLIEDCEDIEEIKSKIELALSDVTMIKKAVQSNNELRERLSYEAIKEQVQRQYNVINDTVKFTK